MVVSLVLTPLAVFQLHAKRMRRRVWVLDTLVMKLLAEESLKEA